MKYAEMELDRDIRFAAFDFLVHCAAQYGEILPYQIITRGFIFKDERVPLMGPQGIFKPRVLPELPLSITTAPEIPGKIRPYDDRPAEAGAIVYKYRGTDPHHYDNVGLRKAMQFRAPLIYFYGVEKGFYRPTWPVYVIGDDPASLSFRIRVDEQQIGMKSNYWEQTVSEDGRRRYITVEVQQRLHQVAFRAHVIRAYQESCAICRLRHPELLDAAHILEDKHPRGVPAVSNGLALCAIHHKAYDKNVLAVKPDYSVEIQDKVLHEIDGPMLRHGLQGFQGTMILLPRRLDQWPDREALAERYNKFKAVG
jgi:putative restriction endonuclease